MQPLVRSLLVAAATAAAATAQFTLVTPNGYASTPGNAANAYPWNRAASSMRIQFIYDSSNFTLQGVAGPIIISRLRFRVAPTTATWTGGLWSTALIDMSTAAVDYLTPSSTFASNHGLDLTNVVNGPIVVQGGTGNGAGVPGPWYVDVPLTTNFVYDPAAGSDLVMDIQVDGANWSGASASGDNVSSTAALPPLGSRVYSSTSATATTGTVAANYIGVTEFTYVPAAGLWPSFNATPAQGAAPLAVQFTDNTFTSDPGGVTSWSWDFDGDGIVDSNLQNPSHVYTSCGDYNVTLTVTDAANPVATLTKTGYIVVDPIAAAFTATPTSGGNLPLIVQFTDASTNASGWAWDFDNDGIVDSTQQNPLWAYVNPGFYSVALTVTNACRTASVVQHNLIYAGGVILPAAAAAADGNSSNSYPLDYANQVHVQEIFDSSHFTNAGITSPIRITGLHMRANSLTTTWLGDTVSNLQLDMSTAPVDYLAISTTYAANHGPDLTTVYNAPVAIPAGSSTAGVPGPYFASIPFSTAFLYDPSLGDLTFDYISSGVASATNTPSHDTVTTAGVALSKRVYNTTNNSNLTGTLYSGEVALVIAVDYSPATGLFPAFTATPTSGTLNTTVQFTDQTYTSDPGGVVAWQWDLDGDSVVDSTLQNPSFTYTTEGIYTVTLTVVDATHGVQLLTKPAYIAIDTVTASFTANVVTGTTVQFTDTSTGNPVTWAWDFDGDSIVDSFVPNPIFTYPAAGSYNCTLTVTDAISTDTTTVNLGVGIIPMPGFGSTYSSATSTRGVWFQTPVRFSIVSLQVPDESNHGLQNVAVYRLAGAPPIYSASATGGLEFLQIGTPSVQTIPCGLSFDAGEYIGIIAACGDNTTMRTSYATPTGPFASSILGQPTTLTRLITQTNLVTTLGTGAYSQEVAAAIGRVNVGVSSCVGLAYGTGTPSGAGPAAPTLTTTALPFLGQTAQLTIDNQDSNALGLLTIGIGRANVPTPFGTVLINRIGSTFLLNGGVPMNAGQYTYSVPVPNNPALQGVGPLTWQNFNLLLTSNQVAMSNGQEWWLAQ